MAPSYSSSSGSSSSSSGSSSSSSSAPNHLKTIIRRLPASAASPRLTIQDNAFRQFPYAQPCPPPARFLCRPPPMGMGPPPMPMPVPMPFPVIRNVPVMTPQPVIVPQPQVIQAPPAAVSVPAIPAPPKVTVPNFLDGGKAPYYNNCNFYMADPNPSGEGGSTKRSLGPNVIQIRCPKQRTGCSFMSLPGCLSSCSSFGKFRKR